MNNRVNLFFIILFGLIIEQCSSRQTNNTHSVTDFELGKVNKNMKCKNYPEETYAIYIPTSYLPSKKYPIIYILDSHGEAEIPVEKYKDLAEKYEYILVGSYRSQNGYPMQTHSVILFNLFEDTQNRLTIDKKKIYLMGFSGGARVAASYAINNPGITGVIGCGAGFADIKSPESKNMNYFGWVGNEDFNYVEMKKLDKSLDSLNIKHQIRFFNGEHAWPSSQLMKETFFWLSVNAIRDNINPKNDKDIQTIQKYFNDSIAACKKTSDPLILYYKYKEAINFLDGLTDITDLKNELTAFEKNPVFLNAKKEDEQIDKTEILMTTTFQNAIQVNNPTWWKNEVSKMLNEKNNLLLQRNKRVLNFCSLMAYMSSTRALNNDNKEEAKKILHIYELVDEDNSESYYLNAHLYMMLNKPDIALNYLDKAIQYKFNSVDRLMNDPAFETLKQNEKFLKIIEQAKKNKKIE